MLKNEITRICSGADVADLAALTMNRVCDLHRYSHFEISTYKPLAGAMTCGLRKVTIVRALSCTMYVISREIL